MVKIYVREGQNIDGALRVLKKKMQREKIMEGHKKHLRYEKPSDKLRKERFRRYMRAKRAQHYIDTRS
ncbi:MAG TPA: 30S ribosomal protein S21 [Candidatus Omnitrophota bacterium]|nr:30S ribosomal protein S21 [Candidatus Omnitrophota bacterium]